MWLVRGVKLGETIEVATVSVVGEVGVTDEVCVVELPADNFYLYCITSDKRDRRCGRGYT